MLRTKLISSPDKCFIESNYDEFAEIKSINIYRTPILNHATIAWFSLYNDRSVSNYDTDLYFF